MERTRLANALSATRTGRRMSLREAAADAGVSVATYRRAEDGAHLPQGENAIALLEWAGLLIGSEHERNALEALALALEADERLTAGERETILTVTGILFDFFVARR